MNLSDYLDMRLLDGASKVAFGAVDSTRHATRWYRRRQEEVRAWRIANPDTFDQLAVIGLAAIIEVVTAALKRR